MTREMEGRGERRTRGTRRLAALRSILGSLALLVPSSGCALHYYDPETGIEHVWGLAHVKMRTPPADPGEDARAVATQVSTLGGLVARTPEGTGLVLGWHRGARVVIVDADTQVRIEWPTSELFDVRVGSRPPESWAPTPSPEPVPAETPDP